LTFLSLWILNSQMDNWQLVHAYRKLAREGKAKPFSCADCDNELMTLRARNDEPALYCGNCDLTYTPGADLMGQVRAVVYEHTEFG
jgi:transcription elongation factor Elf1